MLKLPKALIQGGRLIIVEMEKQHVSQNHDFNPKELRDILAESGFEKIQFNLINSLENETSEQVSQLFVLSAQKA